MYNGSDRVGALVSLLNNGLVVDVGGTLSYVAYDYDYISGTLMVTSRQHYFSDSACTVGPFMSADGAYMGVAAMRSTVTSDTRFYRASGPVQSVSYQSRSNADGTCTALTNTNFFYPLSIVEGTAPATIALPLDIH